MTDQTPPDDGDRAELLEAEAEVLEALAAEEAREAIQLAAAAAERAEEAIETAAVAELLEEEAERLEANVEFTFTVDGEPYTTHQRQLTPNHILGIAGLDPASVYLMEVDDGQHSFKDQGDAVIKMRHHMAFVSLSVGPKRTS